LTGVTWPPTEPAPRENSNRAVIAAIAAFVVLVAVGTSLVVMSFHHHPGKQSADQGFPVAATAVHGTGGGVVSRKALLIPVVDAASAAKVTRTYWQLHAEAFTSRDLKALATLSTGAAKRWEQSGVRCGCLKPQGLQAFLGGSYLLSPDNGRPTTTFVAEVHTFWKAQPWAEVLTFARSGEAAPWKVSEESGFPLTTSGLDRPTGRSAALTSSEHQRALGATERLAALWQEAKDTGRVSTTSGFVLHGQTLDRVAYLADYPAAKLQSNGLMGSFNFSASKHDPLVEEPIAGGELACQVMHERVIYQGSLGHVVYQDPARQNWGPLLAPGAYRYVIDRDLWQTCFRIPEQASQPIRVYNQDTGDGIASAPASAKLTPQA
jgi:hypothetical protein